MNRWKILLVVTFIVVLLSFAFSDHLWTWNYIKVPRQAFGEFRRLFKGVFLVMTTVAFIPMERVLSMNTVS